MATVYEIVTERIVKALEAGSAPWRRNWAVQKGALPRSFVTGKEYRGINMFLLSLFGTGRGQWVTYKQAVALGGNVKKGEEGMPIVFWKPPTVKASKGKASAPAVSTEEKRGGMILRYYTVFQVEQCEGLTLPHLDGAPLTPFNPIEACESIIASMPNKPSISHGGPRAYYQSGADAIRMPEREAFTDPAFYYGTLFHELTHSTGHKSRVGRKTIMEGTGSFGDHAYSQEELVAEMGAAFLAAHAGIDGSTEANSAAYLASWIKVLKGNPQMVVIAAAQAQKAADYIRAVTFEKKEETETEASAA